MIERWYKAPVDCLFDVRIARMPAGLFRAWHQLQALASLNGGNLPPVEQIAYSVRSALATVVKRLEALAERGLAILADGCWRLLDALAKEETDAESGLSGAERTRRWRERRNGEQVASEAPREVASQVECVTAGDGAVTAGDAPREEKKREYSSVVTPRDAAPRDAARRDFQPIPPAASPDAQHRVWIAQGSPEWSLWAAYRKATGQKSAPTDKRGGWWFSSMHPPALPDAAPVALRA